MPPKHHPPELDSRIALVDIVPDPLLEQPDCYELTDAELKKSEYAEALYERGRRLRYELRGESKEGDALMEQAARKGHPVALASCFRTGLAAQLDANRAAALYRESAERGHPLG